MTEIYTKNSLVTALSQESEKNRRRWLNPFLFKLYLLRKLPLALLAGVKIQRLDAEGCDVSIPYRWLTTNPFRSTYFAALSMAAELSTGALALLAVQNSSEPISSLIIELKANFVKKATSLTKFSCDEGDKNFSAVHKATETGEAIVVDLHSVWRNSEDSTVAEFTITWSFKKKKTPK